MHQRVKFTLTTNFPALGMSIECKSTKLDWDIPVICRNHRKCVRFLQIRGNIFAGPLLSIPDATLFMSNMILKRFAKKYIDFHKKIPIEKYIFWMSKIFDHDFRKFSWKISKFLKSRKFQLEFLLEFLRFRKFWKFSWKFSKIVIGKFDIQKIYFSIGIF